jgi:hypothetical protein
MKNNTTLKASDSKLEKSLPDKTTNQNNSSSKVNEVHTDPLFNPDVIEKRKVIINTSTSKAMYLFPKAERFHNSKIDNSSFFYNLPSVANNRSASIGFGTKTNFVPSINGRSTNIYDIPREFDLNSKNNGSPKYSFGLGRDVCRKPLAKDEKSTPGPTTYSPYKKFGVNGIHYSMSFRFNRPNPNYNNPGPGSYKFQQLNVKGKYDTSVLRNSPVIKFPEAKRFKYNYNNNPGPGAYKDENLMKGTGVVFNSKFGTNLGKTMGSKLANIGEKLITPGPGAYEYFSDFEGFGKYRFPKLKKSASTGNMILESKKIIS